MVGESIAILIVLGVTAAMALRSGRRAVVKMTLPFCTVPFAYLIGETFLSPYWAVQGVSLQTLRVLVVLIGALAGIILAFGVAKAIASYVQHAKKLYIPFALVFVAAMAITYCIRLMG
ncbi:MAG: hypothetical protein ACOX0K_08320 [Oscillospiraceae bacterium]|jgi:hypothetical protein